MTAYVEPTIGLYHVVCIYPPHFLSCRHNPNVLLLLGTYGPLTRALFSSGMYSYPPFLYLNPYISTPPLHPSITSLSSLSTTPLTPFNRYPLLRQATLYMPHHPSCSTLYLFLSIPHHYRPSIPYATTTTTTTTTTTFN